MVTENVARIPNINCQFFGLVSDFELEETKPARMKWSEYAPVYQKTQLENGIRIVTEAMPDVRSVAIGILFDAGSRYEKPSQMGLAHLTEHLIFQGTSSRSAAEIARLMDEGGSNIGAFTTRDYTCYFATVLDDYHTYALDLLGDILLNSIFPEESLAREKSAILHEMDMLHDVPSECVHTLLKSSAWNDQPMGNPVIGLPQMVKGFTREDVIYFVHENYMPDRMIIAAAGNIEHCDFVAQTRDAFWRMLGHGSTRIRRPSQHQIGVSLESMPISQAYFAIGIPVYPYAHPDRYALHVFNAILGGGNSSRLYRRIREDHGLVYSIGSEYHAYLDEGMLVIEGNTSPEYLHRVLRLVMTELRSLVEWKQPVLDEELWKAKMQIRGQHLITSESSHTRMSRLITQEFYFGRHISSSEIVAQIEAIDDAVIQRLAMEILNDGFMNLTVAVVGPDKSQHYSSESIKELLAGFQSCETV